MGLRPGTRARTATGKHRMKGLRARLAQSPRPGKSRGNEKCRKRTIGGDQRSRLVNNVVCLIFCILHMPFYLIRKVIIRDTSREWMVYDSSSPTHVKV
jgi:hypothetical protein